MNSTFKIKLLSSLEKVFLDDKLDDKKTISKASMLRNERYSFQVAYTETDKVILSRRIGTFEMKSDIKHCIKTRKVELVPSQMPTYSNYDENYLRVIPGLYPDPLVDIDECGHLYFVTNQLRSLWITIELNSQISKGNHDIEVIFYDEEKQILANEIFNIDIIDALLPNQDLIFTQWLHCDCLALEYKVAIFSNEHWKLIENYIKTAVKNGINMILTPIFTPPLDTAIDGERPTVQLVDVYKNEPEKYTFNFDMLKKWIDLCHECGVEYFEISHLFTQWGAKHAPKIMAVENGEYKKIFGWDTDSVSEEYKLFLHVFLAELIIFLKTEEIADKCYFHISDEPSKDQIQSYINSKAIVKDILKDFHIMDALSDYEFYTTGAVELPIPASNHIEKFIENKATNLWTYYCSGQWQYVSNRFFSMSSLRNRIIGTQFYKYDIVGFLHWGFNFWFNQFSIAPINPYIVTDGEFFAPSGDTFSVYPGNDGNPVESLRLVVFYEALQDLRAFKLLENLYDKGFVLKLIEENTERPITFKEYPLTDDYLLSLREKVNQAIKVKYLYSKTKITN
ncbi:MAG TPA: DUF4091 domain-containing protein [Clostridiaceae bacterium]